MRRPTANRLVGLLIHLLGMAPLRHLRRALRTSRQIQKNLLGGILSSCQNCEFGKEHGFRGIRTIEEFQRRVPVQTYETLLPYLQKVQQGNLDALLPSNERVHMFGLTSGSTGSPKRIPITEGYVSRFRKTYRLWSSLTLRDHPDATKAKLFALYSDWRERTTPGGIPCGAVTGLLAHLQSPWIKRFMLLPGDCISLSIPEVREAAVLHHALSHRVSFLTAANPSSLLRIAKRLESEADRALRDLHDGGFRFLSELPLEYRTHRDFKPNPERAREIRNRIDKEGTVSPKTVWPELALLSCWTGGTLTPYLEELKKYFPDIPIRDPGLIASEGRFTVPIADNTASGVPDLNGIFFEFHPADDGTEVPVGEAVSLQLPQDLEVGKRYSLLFTTTWGLYRYHIDDIVEVTEKIGDVPLIRFIRKGSGYSSVTGEKLAEDQVVRALERLPRSFLEEHGDSILAPRWGDPPGYLLLLEDTGNSVETELVRTARDLDRSLQTLNVEYESKRKSLRLAPVRIALVEPGTFGCLRQREVTRAGGRSEQYKLRRIRGDLDFVETLAPYRVLGPEAATERETCPQSGTDG
jgi:GH3 auxin-responsive promoter